MVADASGATESSTRTALKLDRPGFYALRQRGPWGVRSRPITANAELVHGGDEHRRGGRPSRSRSTATPAGGDGTDLAPWFLAAALAVLLVEAALAIRLEGPGRAFLALRALALAFLVVALFKPQVGDEAPPTTVVAQGSQGVDPAGAAVERRWAEAAGECHGTCRVLEFGGASRAAGVPGSEVSVPCGCHGWRWRGLVLRAGRLTPETVYCRCLKTYLTILT